MTDRRLDVWCFDEVAGMLVDGDDGLAFEYGGEWVAGGMPPLSQSLPVDGRFGSEAVVAFFGGLLPEGPPRQLLARQLGLSPSNDFSLLAALGGDTAGAVSLLHPGDRPAHPGTDVRWLDDVDLARELDELPTRPMHVHAAGEYRLSLAGVQDKLPVVVGADGRIGLTEGGTPSTHILKTPIARLQDTVANEAYCLAVGRALGINAVEAEPRRVAGREFLLVRRYDRAGAPDATRRVHQEDFCQALGIPAQRKYQDEGGPGLVDLFGLIRSAVAVPARAATELLGYVALSFLVGNHDAHGKNYSLLYLPRSSRAELAPAYDVLGTVVYRKAQPMSRRMAMHIGGEYRPAYVRRRHLDRLIDEAGLGGAAARRRLRALASEAPTAARSVRSDLVRSGWDAPLLGRVVEIVAERAGWLAELAAPAATGTRSAWPRSTSR
ncbi:MAG TPA: type II toxin-antitoxin system HipA family toxin [Solirubrobacteraceae bacterium]|jgi:serine/threonine-protein kinase HipA|nr:type II toxin-antitoxin system HipA family toxin [Solirubrobacteraceae bacterium]